MNNAARLQELDMETAPHAGKRHGRAHTTVLRAIELGRLPAYVVRGRGEGARPLYLVRPGDVDRLFASHIEDLPVTPRELSLV
ncbi:MAG: hypothetical protein KDB26_05670 [Microthrixaceae bacterium]|jgi:hypothetical protein|nr:hypothetical protein [Microthrixaceae bacterium]